MQMDDISAAYFAELGCAGSILPSLPILNS